MNGFRISVVLVALLAGAALAQTTPPDPAKPAPAVKKDAPAAKKDAVKKAAPKKAADNKAAAKPAKKPVEKKVQKAAPTGSGPVVERYKAGEAPNLQGPGGSVIQTSPDAYNVDSAKKK